MTILLIILALIALPMILAAFSSDQYEIKRDVIINKPVPEVYAFTKIIKNQEHYNKWVMTDPHSRKTLTGRDGTVGFIYAWDSDMKQAGKGEQEIIALTENKSIDCEIRFEKPFKQTSNTRMTTEDAGAGKTKVTWSFYGKRNYMMKVMQLLLRLENALGRDMEKSLGMLKQKME